MNNIGRIVKGECPDEVLISLYQGLSCAANSGDFCHCAQCSVGIRCIGILGKEQGVYGFSQLYQTRQGVFCLARIDRRAFPQTCQSPCIDELKPFNERQHVIERPQEIGPPTAAAAVEGVYQFKGRMAAAQTHVEY